MSMNIMMNLKLPLTPFEKLNTKYFELLSKMVLLVLITSSQQFNPSKNFKVLWFN